MNKDGSNRKTEVIAVGGAYKDIIVFRSAALRQSYNGGGDGVGDSGGGGVDDGSGGGGVDDGGGGGVDDGGGGFFPHLRGFGENVRSKLPAHDFFFFLKWISARAH